METSLSPRTALLATVPFGLFGLAWIFSNIELNIPNFVELFFMIAAIVSMFVLFGMGWVKGFPRWSFPAIGFCLLFSLYLMQAAIPVFSKELLGFWAWIPLLVTFAICLIWRPSMTPLKNLFRNIKEDASLILLAFYGFTPFFLFLMCDEIHTVWIIPIALISTGILSIGLFYFLKINRQITRVISIISSGLLAVALTFSFVIIL